ncbi:CZB domain-containing protein [Hydrogenobaculum acidophilum]
MEIENQHDAKDRLLSSIVRISNQLLETIDKELQEISLLQESAYEDKIKDKDFVVTIIDVVESHKIYVKNFFSVLIDNTDWVPLDYTECKFGKWYYSVSEEDVKSKYGDKALKLFKKIGESHKEFHEIGKTILKYYRENNLRKVLTLITDLSDKSRDMVYNCIAFAQVI